MFRSGPARRSTKGVARQAAPVVTVRESSAETQSRVQNCSPVAGWATRRAAAELVSQYTLDRVERPGDDDAMRCRRCGDGAYGTCQLGWVRRSGGAPTTPHQPNWTVISMFCQAGACPLAVAMQATNVNGCNIEKRGSAWPKMAVTCAGVVARPSSTWTTASGMLHSVVERPGLTKTTVVSTGPTCGTRIVNRRPAGTTPNDGYRPRYGMKPSQTGCRWRLTVRFCGPG